METCFVGGEFFGHFLGSLDNPEVEDFGLVKKVVVVTGALAEFGGVVTGITGHNAVYEGGVYTAGVFEPCAELFAEVPQLDVLTDAFLEVLAVFEDELAGEDDKALVCGAFEILEAVIEKLGELAGIAACGLVGELAGGIEGDAGLGGVGNHKTDFGLFGKFEVSLKVLVGVEAAGNHVNEVQAVHGLTVLKALEVEVIEAVLLVEPAYHTFLDGLDNHHGTAKVRLLVGLPDNPLDECTKEVSFSKLNHFFSVLLCLRRRFAV